MKIKPSSWLLAGGVLLALLPCGQFVWQQVQAQNISTACARQEEQLDLEAEREAARTYNERLFRSGIPDGEAAYADYENCLVFDDNGLMGFVEIPAISTRLPIYHGTQETAISNGCGHISGTSLPGGGPNTRTVLSSHSGLSAAGLFTRLDELRPGDRFTIESAGSVMVYEVDRIDVVLPDDTAVFAITPGADEAALVTCTPYGINSHRLVVSGTRVSETNKPATSGRLRLPSWHVWLTLLSPLALVLIVLGGQVRYVQARRKEKRKRL